MSVILYDTSLRDGTQGEGVQLSVDEKLEIARLVDGLGVRYIEGGWPGSNPRDEEFFAKARGLQLTNARLTAFGATRRSGIRCEDDSNLSALLDSGCRVLTIFGKAWRFQATEALRITPEDNLELIEDSVRYLKARVDEVVFDAEHFFDGYADDPEYAFAALAAAERGGADWLVLCDTNGGTLPHALDAAVRGTRARFAKPIGIHTHNDSEVAVANSLAAVSAGATMVQGTLNGCGERCGNANLVSIIPALKLKLGIDCVTDAQLAHLRQVSRTFDEVTNRSPWTTQPYVGPSAFAHKGGVHVDAVQKNSRTYEHIDPASVGNHRRVLLSDLSGRMNVQLKAQELGIELDPKSPETRRILARLKEAENQGYQYESAGASFKLFIDDCLGRRQRYFTLRDLELQIGFGDSANGRPDEGEARVRIELDVGGEVAYSSARGEGPVHALDVGLRSLVDKFYPELRSVRLVDYKVRVITTGEGAGSVVRVLIQSTDGDEVWGTIGVSPNIIRASWNAMLDALEYKLIKAGVAPYVSRQGRASDAPPLGTGTHGAGPSER